jgi:Ribosomal protein S8
MISDPIANFLTVLRNAIRARHRYVDIKKSRMIGAILDVLKARGFIHKVLEKEEKNGNVLRIFLKYTPERLPVLQGLRRISRPGQRKYTGASKMPVVMDGFGLAIVSTPQGVMDGKAARTKNIGGEVLAYVW